MTRTTKTKAAPGAEQPDLIDADVFAADQPTGGREIAPAGPGRGVATADDLAAQPPATRQQFSAMSMMQMVRELALDERVDAGKLETVMRVANQQQDREREIEFYQDKNRAVREMPVIRKDGKIVILDKNRPDDMSLARVQGRFERWADVQAAITPVLTRHNLTLTHRVDYADGHQIVIAVLTHDNGYREESGPMRLPLDTSGGKNNVQGAGSSQTYGIRYTTRAICGLRFENAVDDDGALTAMPDEPMNDQQQRRLEEAERAASRGAEAYETWFHSIPPIDRRWLIDSGRHQQFADQAGLALKGRLPGAKPRAEAPSEPPADQAGAAKDAAADWTAKYVAACEAAATLDALAEVQDKGRKNRDSLKAKRPDLHQQCVDAGSAAYQRLIAAEAEGADLAGEA